MPRMSVAVIFDSLEQRVDGAVDGAIGPGAQVVGGKERAAPHVALKLGIVRGSRAEEDGPLEGAAVQQASQHSAHHGER